MRGYWGSGVFGFEGHVFWGLEVQGLEFRVVDRSGQACKKQALVLEV